MTIPRARTSREMSFFASLASCPACGKRVDPDELTFYGSNDAWSLTGWCPQCRGPLTFRFLTNGNPLDGIQPPGELGVGHSTVIAPRLFIDEIDRLSLTIEHDPTRLPIAAWMQNRDANGRVRVCLAELAKFLPAGADTIPAARLGPEGVADQASRPERYQRTWIMGVLERHARVAASIVADLARIEVIETALARDRPAGIQYLERPHLVAHEAWVQRGKTGPGRLVLVDAEHERMKIGRGVELSGARLDRVNFTEAYLEDATLADAELDSVRLDRGYLYGSLLHRARLIDGSLDGADLKLVQFNDARIEGTRFDRSNLDRSIWAGAIVTAASFTAARFGNANLDGATFTRCDLSGADLSGPEPQRPPPTRARFEDCDLRNTRWQGRDLAGASFIRCKLAGAQGVPASVAGVVIEDPDSTDILTRWGVRA